MAFLAPPSPLSMAPPPPWPEVRGPTLLHGDVRADNVLLAAGDVCNAGAVQSAS